MADFISTLTGQEMDAALSDMAMHTSEAYAVGTRNGSVVTSGDPTYHNNAKYYAEVAASVIPGTVTEAVRWDTPQALTNAQQAQARENIGAMAATTSGVNLLDNPWFTVNQRGFTSNTNTNDVYSVDRWYINSGYGTQTITTNGMRLNNTSGSTYCSWQQAFGKNELAGKTVTMSVWTSDGIYTRTKVIPAQTSSAQSVTTDFLVTGLRLNFYVQASSANASYLWQLYVPAGYDITIRAVKLELGTVSTLANDAPPDYGTELVKCQRYFYRMTSIGSAFPIDSGFATSATQLRLTLHTPVSMRTITSVSINGGSFYAYGAGSSQAVSAISYTGLVANGVVVTCTTSGLTSANIYALMCNNASSYIDISADL